jgi:hypothetical protein
MLLNIPGLASPPLTGETDADADGLPGEGVVGRDDEKSDVVRAWEWCLDSGLGLVGALV